MPVVPTRVVTAAATPIAVSSVRRGVRSTLRNGICASVPPGTRSHAASGARPLPRALMNPVRIASIGGTVTARQTG